MSSSRFLCVAILSSAFMLSGCHTVNVTMQNNATVPLAPSLVVTAKGFPQPAIGVGTVDPTKSVTKTLKLRNGDSYVVNASLPGSAQVYTGTTSTVTSADPKVIDATVQMSVSAPLLPVNDPQSIETAFSTLGPNVGFIPQTVQSINDSFFGGLVLITAPGGGDAVATQVVAPGVLTTANVWNDSEYPITSDKSTAKVTSSSSASIGASVPLWGTIASSFSQNSIYEVDWDMEGFGMISKKEDPSHSDFISAMIALPAAEKASICSSLSDPKSSIMYVNQLYVVQQITYNVTQGTTIAAGANLSGGSVISGSVAYSFAVDNSLAKSLKGQVVNIGGPTWAKDNAPICQAAAPPVPVAPVVGAAPVPPPPPVPQAAAPPARVLAAKRLLKPAF